MIDRRRQEQRATSNGDSSSYLLFPSIAGALIIAAAILLSTLVSAVATRYIAIDAADNSAWLIDRLTGVLYRCEAPSRGKASCDMDGATGSIR